MFLTGSVGEVEAGHVHACLDKPLDFGRRTTGWPDGADYLSSSAQVHSLFSIIHFPSEVQELLTMV